MKESIKANGVPVYCMLAGFIVWKLSKNGDAERHSDLDGGIPRPAMNAP